jgi:hypothetical protein
MATRYYGEPYRPLPRHVLRIGDADRDAAAADLGDHYVAGRLTLDELHGRLARVFEARTHGQLWNVLADLPGQARGQGIAGPDRERALTATAAPTTAKRSRDDSDGAGSDRTAQLAAVSLLFAAMLIWLLTAYLFALHGYGYPRVTP